MEIALRASSMAFAGAECIRIFPFTRRESIITFPLLSVCFKINESIDCPYAIKGKLYPMIIINHCQKRCFLLYKFLSIALSIKGLSTCVGYYYNKGKVFIA